MAGKVILEFTTGCECGHKETQQIVEENGQRYRNGSQICPKCYKKLEPDILNFGFFQGGYQA